MVSVSVCLSSMSHLVEWTFRYSLRRRKLFSETPTLPVLKPKALAQPDEFKRSSSILQKRAAHVMLLEGSFDYHALLDNLTVDHWRQFMWPHASHHLSFLMPTGKPYFAGQVSAVSRVWVVLI